ncbi:MAG: hypothetical protein ACR2GI_01945, partial [Thermomicrobiales bacterium]
MRRKSYSVVLLDEIE